MPRVAARRRDDNAYGPPGTGRRGGAGGRRNARGRGPAQGQPRGRRRRRKGPIIVVLVIVVACAIGVGFLIPPLLNPPETLPLAVPDETPGLNRYVYDPDDPEAESPFTSGPTSVSLSAVGDNLLHLPVIETADLAEGTLGDEKYDFGVLYSGLAEILETHDINFIDVETPMGGDERGFTGYPIFNGPSDDAADIASSGFNLATTATNHAWDQGFEGLESMVDTWAEHPEVIVAGTYKDQADRDNIRTFSKNGLTFAFLAYQDNLNGFTVPKSQKFAVGDSNDTTQVRKDIRRAHELAEVVIVAMSWGSENSFEPSDSQRETAQLLADEGVDLVIGFGPHVIQPVEWVTAGETPVKSGSGASTKDADASADASTDDEASTTQDDAGGNSTQDTADDGSTDADGSSSTQGTTDDAQGASATDDAGDDAQSSDDQSADDLDTPSPYVSGEDGEDGAPHRTLVVYSLGNYVSNQPSAQNLVEGCFTCDFVRNEEGAISIADPTWIPLVGHFVAGGVAYGTTGHNAYPLSDYTEEMARQNVHLGTLQDPLGYVRDLTLQVIDPEVVDIDFGNSNGSTSSSSTGSGSTSSTTTDSEATEDDATTTASNGAVATLATTT